MPPYVARFTPAGSVDVAEIPAATAIGASLVMPPGTYSYGSSAYNCTTEGLYRWLTVNADTTNRLVYGNDLYALMSGLSWLCVHGRSDEALTNAQLEARAKTSKLRLRCGPTVDFCRYILTGRSINSRVVRFLTMVPPVSPWAGIDEGHVTMEVQTSSGWLNFDPNNAAYYRNGAGVHVSAREMMASIADNSFQISPLDCDSGYEVMPFESGKFDVTGWKEMIFLRPDGLRTWARRIMQAIGWDHPNGEIWWLLPAGAESRASWLLAMQANYRVKTAAEISAAFYP